jgi:hypothetical protein
MDLANIRALWNQDEPWPAAVIHQAQVAETQSRNGKRVCCKLAIEFEHHDLRQIAVFSAVRLLFACELPI